MEGGRPPDHLGGRRRGGKDKRGEGKWGLDGWLQANGKDHCSNLC